MNHLDPDESYLTVAEVASTLKLNQQTVRNWIDQGHLPALRVGRRVRIKRSDFMRILEESYNPGSPPPARPAGPSADDFWGGEPVGLAEPAMATGPAAAQAAGTGPGNRADGVPNVDLAASPAQPRLPEPDGAPVDR